MRGRGVLLALAGAAALCGAESSGTVTDNPAWNTLIALKDNATALRTVSAPPWVSAVELRGTMAILQTCVLTLFACIYTALHLDVPVWPDLLSVLVTKVIWVLRALCAPEIVLYTAADQLAQALWLKKRLKKLQQKTFYLDVDRAFDFDLRYAFFVVMGGIRLEPEKVKKFTGPDESLLYTPPPPIINLTPDGLLNLAEKRHWIYVKPATIAAKSKANLLQKALVLLQVSYSAMTCMARRAHGLPLALLEVHTMVHVVCAVAMYILWFKKPLDVSEPEIVYDPKWDPCIAAMIQRNFYQYETEDLVVRSVASDQPASPPWPDAKPVLLRPETDSSRRKEGFRCGNWEFWPGYMTLLNTHGAHYSSDLPFSAKTLQRWLAVSQELDDAKSAWRIPKEALDALASTDSEDRDNIKLSDLLANHKVWRLEEAVHGYFYDVAEMYNLIRNRPWVVALAVALSAVYGGVHLSAWDFDFPTPTENLLWKIMCLIVIGAIPTLVTVLPIYHFLRRYEEAEEQRLRLAGRPVYPYNPYTRPFELFYLFLGLVLLLASGCGLYIVVESFISLRKVPIGVYYTPSWLQMVPHG